MSNSNLINIGVISDTHGLLRPEALETLSGSEMIIHAGDIGAQSILDQLEEIAPVRVIRGNVDWEPWTQHIPLRDFVEAGACSIYVLHDIGTLDIDPVASGVNMVIYGHSHKPDLREKDGVWYLNPGSAGPRRFDYPVSVARLEIRGEKIETEILKLDV